MPVRFMMIGRDQEKGGAAESATVGKGSISHNGWESMIFVGDVCFDVVFRKRDQWSIRDAKEKKGAGCWTEGQLENWQLLWMLLVTHEPRGITNKNCVIEMVKIDGKERKETGRR